MWYYEGTEKGHVTRLWLPKKLPGESNAWKEFSGVGLTGESWKVPVSREDCI